MTNGRRNVTSNILLIEYQKAQDSAEHHDTLIWTVSSIIFVGLTALIGFIANNFSAVKFEPITLLISFLGLILIGSLWRFTSSFRYYKNLHYYRCKQIEIRLGMENHLLTDPTYNAANHEYGPQKPRKPYGNQSTILNIVLFTFTMIFLIILLNYFRVITI